ncbi:MAG: hypothetical protein ABSG21_10335 [Spirochaetia bacterium]|jgi:hypothetical protein
MARGKIGPILVVSFLLLGAWSLFAQAEKELISKYGYIGLPDGHKILVRYSTIDEVLRSLGTPTEKQYFAQGGEDFGWDDFWVYTYEKRNLRFSFEKKGRKIIRIDANTPELKKFAFPFGLDSSSGLDAIVDTLRGSPGVINAGKYRDAVTYGLSSPKEFMGVITSESPEKEWYYVYYFVPWKEYGQ